jgi:hypothetical protein
MNNSTFSWISTSEAGNIALTFSIYIVTTQKIQLNQAPVAHAYNPRYSGAEVRRLMVQSQSGKIILQDSILKKTLTKKGWWSDSRCRL